MLTTFRFPFALIIYIIGFVLLFPLYQFRFDVDGVGYLSVMKLLAQGNFYDSINGYWSPLHSWLVVPLYKAGLNEFTAFNLSNGLIGTGILYMVHRLLNKTAIPAGLKAIVLLAAIPIVMIAVFHDLAADPLVCLLLLVYTDIITEKDFFENPHKNMLCGIVGALSYFAKTYAFPFFLLHFILVQIFLFRKSGAAGKRRILFKNIALSFGCFFLLAAPWVYALYHKYGYLTFGYSGQLNLSWAIFPGTNHASNFFWQPPGPLTSYWQDPYYLFKEVQYHPYHFSLSLILQEAKICLHNFIRALRCFTNISFLSIAVVLTLFLYSIKKKNSTLFLFGLVMIVLPAGYIAVHIETRFLWTVAFLALIAGTHLQTAAFQHFSIDKKWQWLCWIIFFGSFWVYPVDSLKDGVRKGGEVFHLAAELKEKGITGATFAGIDPYNEMIKLAYMGNNKVYGITQPSFTYDELREACRTYQVDYFFFYYQTPNELETFKLTSLYKGAAGEIATGRDNLLLLRLRE